MSRAAQVLRAFFAALVASAALATSATATVTPFTATYSASYIDYAGSSCSTTMPLTGLDPGGSDRPVFIFLVGAGEPYDGAEAPAILRAAAAKGFVAASVSYPQWQYYAAGIEGSSRCIFNGSSPASAVSQVCARRSANCADGIVVAGFSQGSVIALRARNHDKRVRAAYLLGNAEDRYGWDGTLRWQMATVAPSGTRALPNTALRIVDGIDDAPSDKRDELNDMTGRRCAVTAFSCLTSSGAGWYVVRDSQVASAQADHCYFMGGGPWTSCTPTPAYDHVWLTSTTAPWALQPALAFLRRRTG